MMAETITLPMAGADEPVTVLAPGARVRHRRHPELTGRIKCHEWNERGVLSSIPYNVAWDDNSRACDLLGWFYIYAADTTVEVVADA
jgi:hypothetical protein